MKLTEALESELNEIRGKGSFDYSYWFWAKKGDHSYGIGYARQPIELDIQRVGKEAEDAVVNIKDVIDSLDKHGEAQKNLEIIEKKIKSNTKRVQGIIDLFGSPIVINWLSGISTDEPKDELETPRGDPPTLVSVPLRRDRDVTYLTGKDIDVVRLFRDPETTNLLKRVDWKKVKINDQNGDTQNTIMAKFVANVFVKADPKKLRAIARGSGLEDIMSNLKFKDEKKGVEIVPFKPTDYKFFPEDTIGSKKMVSYLGNLMKENFQKVFRRAKQAF
jgi:hypothetical protein